MQKKVTKKKIKSSSEISKNIDEKISKKKILSFKIITILLSVIVALLISEIIVRFYYFGTASFSIEKMNTVSYREFDKYVISSNNPEIGYVLKPNLNTYLMTVPLKTNSWGLADKEYAVKKPSNTFRVGVIGDSFTMAEGVEENKTYHSILEDRLNKEFGNNKKFEFINFAACGYDFLQYIGNIKYGALTFNPDMLLIGFCAGNDFDYPGQKPLSPLRKRYNPLRNENNFFTTSYLYYFIKIYLNKNIKEDKVWKIAHKEDLEKEFLVQKDYINWCFKQLDTLSQFNKIPVTIAWLATNSREKEIEKKNFLKSIATEHSFYFIDISPYLPDKENKEYHFIPGLNGHPNEKAHKLYSEVIYNYFIKNKLLPIN